MPDLRTLALPAVAALALALGACGDDNDDTSAGDSAATQTQSETPTETQAAAPTEISENLDEKPSITPPEGEPPSSLESKDIVVGKGPAAKKGDNVTVQYVGVNFSNGAEFDASWNSGQPFTFTLGTGNVIPGWDEGVQGMKQGGRRMLTIPPDLAYGPAGSPPAIGPNETLIFVIDVEKITRGQ
jgi:peptidylprolyl isomerase